MAMAKFVLKTLPGIDRPAIASFFPTLRGESVLLDLGANVECDADNLVQFARHGRRLRAHRARRCAQPTVGLLNVGSEDMKGNDAVARRRAMLRDAQHADPLPRLCRGRRHRRGHGRRGRHRRLHRQCRAEDHEGTAQALHANSCARSFQHSLLARLGSLLRPAGAAQAARAARSAPLQRRAVPRPQRHRVKSHGGTDAFGFANAIGVAVDLVADGVHREDPRGLRAASTRPGRAAEAAGGASNDPSARRSPAAAPICRSGSSPTPSWPSGVDTVRRLDRAAHRHPPAPHRRRRRADLRPRVAAPPSGRSPRPASRPPTSISIVLATTTPDHTFPATATQVQAQLGMTPRRRVRRAGGLLRLRLSRSPSPTTSSALGQAPTRAGDRRRDLLAHPRLDTTAAPACCSATAPARWCSTAVAGDGATGRPRRPVDHICTPTAATTTCSMSMAARPPPARSAICAWRGARCSATPSPASAEVVDEALAANGLAAGGCRLAGAAPGQHAASSTASGASSGLPAERVSSPIDRHANTSAASIPLALDEAAARRPHQAGHLVLLEAMGGGLTWGAALVRW